MQQQVLVVFIVVLIMVSITLIALALWQDKWYHINTATTSYIDGLFKRCTNGNCVNQPWDGFTSLQCTRSGDTEKSRWTAVMALTFITGGCGIPSALFVLLSLKYAPRIFIMISISFTLLAFASGCTVLALYASNIESWLFCGVSYCHWLATISAANCLQVFGHSYIMVAIGTGLFMLAIAALSYLYVDNAPTTVFYEQQSVKRSKSREPITEGNPTSAIRTSSVASQQQVAMQPMQQQQMVMVPQQQQMLMASQPQSQQHWSSTPMQQQQPLMMQQQQPVIMQQQPVNASPAMSRGASMTSQHQMSSPVAMPVSGRPPAPIGRPPAVYNESQVAALHPGEDWVRDTSGPGLYWSASQNLFLDIYSMQYYDAEAQMWFDPKRDLWYSLTG